MSTISASTTSTTGFKVTSDTTGTLVFQTGASPTTAMSISSSQIISFTNPPTATGAGSVATNTAYGTSALAANTTGAYNTVTGYQAGYNNTTGTQNVFQGSFAGYNNTTGSYNTSLGYNAYAVSGAAATGNYNTAIGNSALNQNTTANANTAVGYQAGYQITGVGTENTCLGYKAGYGITTGQYNTFIGTSSGQNGTTTGTLNTCVGIWSGASLTSGSGNTFVGSYGSNGSGSSVTTGSKNTILGAYTGNQGGVDIRTSSNNIVLSDGDGNPRAYWNSSGIMTTASRIVVGESVVVASNVYTGGFIFSGGGTQTVLTIAAGECYLFFSAYASYGAGDHRHGIYYLAGRSSQTATGTQIAALSSTGTFTTSSAGVVQYSAGGGNPYTTIYYLRLS